MFAKFFKKITYYIFSTVVVISSVFITVYVYASFADHLSGYSQSDQDFEQNVLGANNSNNHFDSSGVSPNNNGSIVERVKYLTTIANKGESDTIFYVGGNSFYCKKRVINDAGQVAISNINNTEACDSGKTCNNGVCQ